MFKSLKSFTTRSQRMSSLLHDVCVPTKEATFSMACFWAPDCLFGVTKGVIRTRVGYTGGTTKNPVYRQLDSLNKSTKDKECNDETDVPSVKCTSRNFPDRGDHTESILIDYDPNVISYAELLDIFWRNHDPTAKMKRQYTSIIFYHDEEQKKLAESSLNERNQKLGNTVLTDILPASIFHDAEDYHQKYRLRGHPSLCKTVGLISGSDFKRSHLAARLNGYVYGQGGINQFNEEVDKLGLSKETADYVRTIIVKYEGQGLTC